MLGDNFARVISSLVLAQLFFNYPCNLPSYYYASWKLKGHRDKLDIPGPHSKEQLMDNVCQMSARNIPDLSRSNPVSNMLVVVVVGG